jgi:hypothetical protein
LWRFPLRDPTHGPEDHSSANSVEVCSGKTIASLRSGFKPSRINFCIFASLRDCRMPIFLSISQKVLDI